MPYEFKFPDVGEGIVEGEIVKWLVKEGDIVKEDQNIVQIETDKAVVDVPSPKSGKILKISFKEGDIIKVGETLVVIGSEGDKVPKTKIKKEIKTLKKAALKKRKSVGVVGELEEAPEEEGTEVERKPHAEPMKGIRQTQKVLASPAIRKLASDLKIDLSKINGSGEGGRILRKDFEQIKPGAKATAEQIPQQTITIKKKYDEYGYIERIPLKGIRKTIAQNMIKSQTEAAQVTAMEDIDVSKLWKLRQKEKKHFAIEGIKLTFLPFIIKACIAAMKENPILNSSIEGEEIIIKKYFNIGVAVETEVGLMVPVIKIAEKKSIAKVAKEIQDLAEKARTRKIDIMDLKGSTFTITNYGSVGGNYGTPIINPGEAAILGLGRIFDRVVLDEKTKKIKNVKILPISLTFDHRILDGAQAARFLESLKMFLEDPDHLF
ncbi:MAG: 2-oxo acid dehydrogenase subunit E2 [Nanoarchaeota archaeon]|nr:2-oxo acid dehydrogenase subunit E2 [Nanoarchaeota archaeon]